MTLWIALALLSLLALQFVVWPLYRSSGRLTPILATVIVLTVGISTALYYQIGRPDIPSGVGSVHEADDMVSTLAARLEDNPDDLDGWMMLGRSYHSMQQYDQAVAAFETAFELEHGENADTMVALAIALMGQQGGQMSDRSSALFENALALDPKNGNALFYSGGAAAQRGDTALAADRWETLLSMDAPPEIQELLRRKINEWRGVPAATIESPTMSSGALVSINLSLSDLARTSMPADATVYVIARDPAQPSPPIAVTPRRLSDLPTVVELSDENAMVAGRPLSGFTELEIVARVSMSGNPTAQSGDWSGSLRVSAKSGQTVDLVIDQKIP
ncbi:MAG: tetratricopeptide repeat protein [Woeseiaceae bacterium]|nr:tetratricopeptide repeat protein [Woeseiaceae bacterium]